MGCCDRDIRSFASWTLDPSRTRNHVMLLCGGSSASYRWVGAGWRLADNFAVGLGNVNNRSFAFAVQWMRDSGMHGTAGLLAEETILAWKLRRLSSSSVCRWPGPGKLVSSHVQYVH